MKRGVNWGVKTGVKLTVIDFDTPLEFIHFIAKNMEKLPPGTPIVKTGRGYHIWLRPMQSTKTQHITGGDIKGEGGYVVAPPSVHATGAIYSFMCISV